MNINMYRKILTWHFLKTRWHSAPLKTTRKPEWYILTQHWVTLWVLLQSYSQKYHRKSQWGSKVCQDKAQSVSTRQSPHNNSSVCSRQQTWIHLLSDETATRPPVSSSAAFPVCFLSALPVLVSRPSGPNVTPPPFIFSFTREDGKSPARGHSSHNDALNDR